MITLTKNKLKTLRYRLSDHAWDCVRAQEVRDQVQVQVWDQVSNLVRNQIRDQARNQIYDNHNQK